MYLTHKADIFIIQNKQETHIFSMRIQTATSFIFFLYIWINLLEFCSSYKPVVFVHGIFGSSSKEFGEMAKWIQKTHPGTPFYLINQDEDFQSLLPMWTIVDDTKKQVSEIMKKYPGGIHLICYSQGGLVCRGLLSTTRHNVDTFISLSAPQAGQYGDTSRLKYFFPQCLKRNAYKFLYTDLGQKISIANYWNDPHHQEMYSQYSKFLGPLNNDSVSPNITVWVGVLLFVVCVGDQLPGWFEAGCIERVGFTGCHFGFYNSDEKVIGMKSQRFYKDDSFGLRTLYTQGKVHVVEIPGVLHTSWYVNKTVFDSYIFPWLT